MFEIEQMEQQFDYSLVDNDTADFLRSCEYEINGIAEDARVKFGAVLIKAQEKLASNYKGVFQEWVTSSGMSLDDAYYFINLNKSSRNLDNSQRDNFLKAPKTVQKKVMQKNTPNEMKEAVYSGDIKTNKEFIEAERKRKEAERKAEEYERQLEQAKRTEDLLQSKLEDAENAPPEVIYKERVETVVPDDYVKLKRDSERFKAISDSQENKNIKLQQEIDQLKREISNVDEKSKKYDQLNEEINKMNGRLTEGQLRIKNQKLVYDLVKKSEALISEVAPLTYSISHLGVDDNKYAKEPLIKIAENLEDISSRIRKQLNENKIIEVE